MSLVKASILIIINYKNDDGYVHDADVLLELTRSHGLPVPRLVKQIGGNLLWVFGFDFSDVHSIRSFELV
jgi:hypothetical protein